MAWKWGIGGCHFVGSAFAWSNLSVRGILIGYFFLVT
jgi:hypothetical protein